ncbi:MAG TPA: hypothetical protein VK889_02675 [Solirubrobacterales bacterium]|nr:hypothetical protein [Solirubrobacterales bacterium]
MASRRVISPAPSQAGFALIEVVVSALILAVATGGVVKLLNASGRAEAQERSKAQAYALAQEDQARMRAMRIPSLLTSVKGAPRQVTVGKTTYTITSTAAFINATSENTGCGVGTSSDDYLKIGSEVTWPTRGSLPPIKLQSIINPPGGSLDPGKGTLVINTVNALEEPVSGVGVSGTGAGTFSGSTDSKGCIRFTDLNAGKYTLTTSKAGGYVDEDGNPPGARQISVVGAASNTITIMYDVAGSVEVNFTTRTSASNSAPRSTKAEGIVLVHNGMTAQQKLFQSSPSNTLQEKVKATNLFPFKTAYAVYAGGCLRQTSEESSPPYASVTVTPGTTAKPTVQIPALFLTVRQSDPDGSHNSSGAKVRIDDTDPECSGSLIRNTTTTSTGTLSDPGLPWGTYEICASALVEWREKVKNKWVTYDDYFREYKTVDVKSLTGTSTEIFLSENDSAGSCY